MITTKQRFEFFGRFGRFGAEIYDYWNSEDGFLMDKFRRDLGLGRKQSVEQYVNRNYARGSWEFILSLCCSNETQEAS